MQMEMYENRNRKQLVTQLAWGVTCLTIAYYSHELCLTAKVMLIKLS